MERRPDIYAFLGNDAPIIINTDIDGILSGLLLTGHADARVVGFCNSSDTVWVQPDYANRLDECVFIDMYVPMNGIRCLDQHIIAVDQEHSASLVADGRVLNPNLERTRTFNPRDSYWIKYPFSTAVYILSLLDLEQDSSWMKLDALVGTHTVLDILLRADDALWTSVGSNYTRNAADWWAWIIRQAVTPGPLQRLHEAILASSPRSAAQTKASLGAMFKHRFGCDRPDGGSNRICNSSGFVTAAWRNLVSEIGIAAEIGSVGTEQQFVVLSGRTQRFSPSRHQLAELRNEGTVDDQPVFSYAFVRAPGSPDSLSLTFALR